MYKNQGDMQDEKIAKLPSFVLHSSEKNVTLASCILALNNHYNKREQSN
jgi:hypothetical protein